MKISKAESTCYDVFSCFRFFISSIVKSDNEISSQIFLSRYEMSQADYVVICKRPLRLKSYYFVSLDLKLAYGTYNFPKLSYCISIFSFNVQFLYLLRTPVDAWTKAMKKLAKDVVHRTFDSFSDENISFHQQLTKELLIRSFLNGLCYCGFG